MADDDSVVVLSDSAGESSAPPAGAGAGASAGAAASGGTPPKGADGGGGQWWNKRMDVLDDEAAKELAVVEERTFPQADPPPGLTAELLPFQRESLYWMTRQERSGYRGGILADVSGGRGCVCGAWGPLDIRARP